MSDVALVKAIQQSTVANPTDTVIVYETGMEVEVHQIIRDGEKERTQKFRGLIISMRGSTSFDRVLTIRSDVDGIGIERLIPVNAPTIAKIDILRKFKVRRKNIAFIRELTGKAARLKKSSPEYSGEDFFLYYFCYKLNESHMRLFPV
jgi:large subunit ribosomal protein L19